MRKEWMNPSSLDFTNDYEAAMFYKHYKPYTYIYKQVEGKKILEIGCGAGYGINLVATKADKIKTVDIDIDSLNYAKNNSNATNIEYIHKNVLKGLDFEDNSFDIIISFQVIEHFTRKEVSTYLNEMKRVLKPYGRIYITTPNRDIRLFPLQKPKNKYHPIEYSYTSLKKILEKHYKNVSIKALHSNREIENIFNTRKNQKVYQVFVIKPIKKAVIKVAKALNIKPVKKIINRRSEYKRPRYSLNLDVINENIFWFENNNIKGAIDFMAICEIN
jgi:ubiquinone/menaquinone biosynthesis C-methylase UbiE